MEDAAKREMEGFDITLQELLAEWNKAEKALKQAENIQREVVTPSINELRYAGRKVVEAITLHREGKGDPARRLLEDAIFDCMRARHDAIDAITAYIADKIDDITYELGVDVVLTCYPEMPKLVSELGCIQDAIVHSRENRMDRDAIYATLLKANLPKIYSMYQELRRNEPLMHALAKKRERERFHNRMALWIGIIFTILGALAGIAGLMRF